MAEPRRTTLSVRERDAPTTALVPAEELKEHLPGLEPERQLNDWGRSERIEGIYDRLVADFFYRYWFRAEVEGMSQDELEKLVITLEEEMFAAAEELRFEYAAKLRDEIKELRRELTALADTVPQ